MSERLTGLDAGVTPGDAAVLQLARVESLMGIVHEVVGTLARSSGQLRHELEVLIGQGMREISVDVLRAAEALSIENRQLRQARASRAVIEQAKGVLVLVCDCEPEQAFDLLVELSRRQRRKVREVAAEVVRTRGEGIAAASSRNVTEPALSANLRRG